MDKIEIGEYVRTKKGRIDKLCAILGYEEDEDEAIAECEKYRFWLEDYVGLEKDTTTITYQEIIDGIKNKTVELLSILTKEMYQQNCYIVEREIKA